MMTGTTGRGLKQKQQAEHQAEQARCDALLSAPPGTPASSATSAGGPGMAAPVNAQAALALAEAQMQRQHLESTGASGQANTLRKQQAGDPIQRFAPFFVEVLVQPDAMGFPFQCSVTTWIDTSKGMLMEGSTLPVKYDPQNPSRMVFLFPA